jgi:hypothetical protein
MHVQVLLQSQIPDEAHTADRALKLDTLIDLGNRENIESIDKILGKI